MMLKPIWIKKAALDAIIADGNHWCPKETGGILMGYRSCAGESIITDIVGPGKLAKHEHSSFSPDQLFHQKEIARIYRKSKRLITYLGDWHTHPHSHPYLSPTDKTTINSIATYSAARLTNPLMLIVSPPGNDAKVWEYRKDGETFKTIYQECDIILFE
jgi:integrative and conjugative element protein (TIGR02256 family)